MPLGHGELSGTVQPLPPAMLTSGLTSPFIWLHLRPIKVVQTAIRTLLLLISVTIGLMEVPIRMVTKIDYKG